MAKHTLRKFPLEHVSVFCCAAVRAESGVLDILGEHSSPDCTSVLFLDYLFRFLFVICNSSPPDTRLAFCV